MLPHLLSQKRGPPGDHRRHPDPEVSAGEAGHARSGEAAAQGAAQAEPAGEGTGLSGRPVGDGQRVGGSVDQEKRRGGMGGGVGGAQGLGQRGSLALLVGLL